MLAEYVGVPFVEHGRDGAGVDCWGLVRLVYAEKLGIALPDMSDGYASTSDKETLQRLVTQGKSDWHQIDARALSAYDVVLLSNLGVPHIGLFAGEGLLLHVEPNSGTVLERLTDPRIARRVREFYRHEAFKC